MKLNKTTLIAALALGSLLTLGATVNAQDTTATNAAPAAPASAAPGRRMISIDQWNKILALTDDEKTNFQAVIQDQRQQMMALRNDDSIAPEDKRAKNQEIRKATLAKLKDILTPDQFAKYQKLAAGGRRGGNPPAAPAAPAPAAN